MVTDTARTLYASFPPALKAAMKVAAERNDWCRKTWASQTEALADAMTRGWTADELADAYRNPPPERFEITICCWTSLAAWTRIAMRMRQASANKKPPFGGYCARNGGLITD